MTAEPLSLPKIYQLDRWKRAYTIGCCLVLGVGMPALVAWYSWDNGGVAVGFAMIFFLFLSVLGFALGGVVVEAKTVLFHHRNGVVTAFRGRAGVADDVWPYCGGPAPG